MLAFCVLLALLHSLFWLGSFFLLSRVFCSSCLGFSVGLPWVFLSCAIAFLSSSRILLLCRGLLCALFFPPFSPFGDFVFSVFNILSFFYTGFRFSSSSVLWSLLGFIPFLGLPRLPLLCFAVGSSWCVSSYGFVVGWASFFLVLCLGCFLLDFFRVFTSCFRFLVIFSSWRGFAAVW